MIGVPPVLLTFIGIIFFIVLLLLVFMPSFFSNMCSSHTIGYEYVCRLTGYGW